jgi:DNA repair exonuclease SbcCD ATPase subunit
MTNELPSSTDLQRLPLRLLIAFTARAAKRAIAKYGVAPDRQDAEACRQAVRDAVRLAMEFAAGSDPAAEAVSATENAVVQAVLGARQLADVNPAAAFAANAAYAAINATNLALQCTDSKKAQATAEQCTEVCKAAVDAAVAADKTIRAAVLRDWELIQQIDLGRFPSIGKPIDPDVFGPLGPLYQDKRVLTEINGLIEQLALQREDIKRMRVEMEIQQSRGHAEIERFHQERDEFEAKRTDFEETQRQVDEERQRVEKLEADIKNRERDLDKERKRLEEEIEKARKERAELQLELADADRQRQALREVGAELIGVLQKHPLLTELIDSAT